MARTISEIQTEIITQKNLHTELSLLNSTSATAIWRLWTYIVAVVIWSHEQLWELFKVEIQEIAAREEIGTKRWYQGTALAYQHGDALVYDASAYRYGYASVDTSLQVVKHCAIRESGGIVQVKVAGEASGVLTPLSAPEEAGLLSYLDKLKMAGTFLSIINQNPDDIKLTLTVYVDPIVIDYVNPVESAINSYLEGLPFDSIMRLSALVDAIQAVRGVVDVAINSAEAKHGALPYTPISTSYIAQAGYMRIDSAFPLNTSITYIPTY